MTAPDTRAEAFRCAVEPEKDNVALYDGLLAATEEPGVRRSLQNPQSASRDRHLPAFECCVRRGR
ncbi:protein of unknown function [Methylocaldum szegediense]|uniref:Uncharacterized protein n=1 Tax=Methylocaldum szegediense TaxID=73780 RepID=A0ABM9HWT4_9GAMM|nr:protein of unknown function [Methylocaldum szegediense]